MSGIGDFLREQEFGSLDEMLRGRKAKRKLPDARTLAIVAARKRGWSLERIGFAAGISGERVRQILAKNDIAGIVKLKRRHGPLFPRKCPGCGKIDWLGPKAVANQKYCSRACQCVHTRKAGGRMGAIAVIEMRLNGMPWMEIQKVTGHTYQTFTINIWWLLHEYGLLDVAILERILSRRGIEYQMRASGLVPTRDYLVSPNWLEMLKARVIADGDDRPMTRKYVPYQRKRWPTQRQQEIHDTSRPRGARQPRQRTDSSWNDQEIQFLRDNYRSKLTANEIGKQLKREPSVVSRMALQLGLRGRGRVIQTVERETWDPDKLRYLREHVMTDGTAAVGVALGIPTKYVLAKAKRLGLSPPKWLYTNNSYLAKYRAAHDGQCPKRKALNVCSTSQNQQTGDQDG
jgi:hypothetical protein